MGLHVREEVKDMIFMVNPNPKSLSFEEIWSFNMVLALSLAGDLEFKPPLCNLNPHLFIWKSMKDSV